MCKYKGVGKITAVQLLFLLPELGEITKREATALSGLAPYANESGTIKKQRSTKRGGRRTIKPMMYMSTMSALIHNPKIKEFYTKLVMNGKKKMVALVACMRKIIVHLNAILRDKELRIEMDLKERKLCQQ